MVVMLDLLDLLDLLYGLPQENHLVPIVGASRATQAMQAGRESSHEAEIFVHRPGELQHSPLAFDDTEDDLGEGTTHVRVRLVCD